MTKINGFISSVKKKSDPKKISLFDRKNQEVVELKASANFYPIIESNIINQHRQANLDNIDKKNKIKIESSIKSTIFISDKKSQQNCNGFTNFSSNDIPNEVLAIEKNQNIVENKQFNKIPNLTIGDSKHFKILKFPSKKSIRHNTSKSNLPKSKKLNKRSKYRNSYKNPNEPIQISTNLIQTNLNNLFKMKKPYEVLKKEYKTKELLFDEDAVINGIKNRVNSKYPPVSINIENISSKLTGIMGRQNCEVVVEMLLNDLLGECVAILSQKEQIDKKVVQKNEIQRIANLYLNEIQEFYDMQNNLFGQNYNKKDFNQYLEEFRKKNKKHNNNYIEIKSTKTDLPPKKLIEGIVDYKMLIQYEYDNDRIKNQSIKDKLLREGRYDPSYYKNTLYTPKVEPHTIYCLKEMAQLKQNADMHEPFKDKNYIKALELICGNMIEELLLEVTQEFKSIQEKFVEETCKFELGVK